MKAKHFLYSTAIAAMALGTVSCTNNDDFKEVKNNAEVPLQVQVGINQNAGTRAGITATSFTNGETVGLYLYKGTGIADVQNNAYPQVSPHKSKNSPYQESAGLWQAKVAGEGIILSDVQGILYGYYPYAASNDKVEADAIPVEVKAAQGSGLSDGLKDVAEQTDYMWADPFQNVSNVTSSTTLKMNHALSMVSFKFIKGDYPGAGVVSSIKLMNNATRENIKNGPATMNIGTGALSITGRAGDITITPNTALAKEAGYVYANNAEVARMLVYPTGEVAFSNGDVKAQIVLDGKTYTLPLPATAEANRYVAGKNYEYTFKLKGKGFGQVIPGDDSWKDDVLVQVKAWIDVQAGGGDVVTPDENPVLPGK